MSEANLPEVRADEPLFSAEENPPEAEARAEDPGDDELQPFALEEFCAEQESDDSGGEPTVWCANRARLRFEFSRFHVSAQDLDTWCQGKLISLDDSHDAPVCVYLDDTLLARGVLVSQQETIGVRITELVAQDVPEAA